MDRLQPELILLCVASTIGLAFSTSGSGRRLALLAGPDLSPF
jgi:hypothetical protein